MNNIETTKEKAKENIYGFDWLRAICCVMVVLWHSSALDLLNNNPSLIIIKNIINFNILLLAVPIFIQISLILFLKKRKVKAKYFLESRIPRLLSLYTFWFIVRITFDQLVGIPVFKFLMAFLP